jgi:hypothetical protein
VESQPFPLDIYSRSTIKEPSLHGDHCKQTLVIISMVFCKKKKNKKTTISMDILGFTENNLL